MQAQSSPSATSEREGSAASGAPTSVTAEAFHALNLAQQQQNQASQQQMSSPAQQQQVQQATSCMLPSLAMFGIDSSLVASEEAALERQRITLIELDRAIAEQKKLLALQQTQLDAMAASDEERMHAQHMQAQQQMQQAQMQQAQQEQQAHAGTLSADELSLLLFQQRQDLDALGPRSHSSGSSAGSSATPPHQLASSFHSPSVGNLHSPHIDFHSLSMGGGAAGAGMGALTLEAPAQQHLPERRREHSMLSQHSRQSQQQPQQQEQSSRSCHSLSRRLQVPPQQQVQQQQAVPLHFSPHSQAQQSSSDNDDILPTVSPPTSTRRASMPSFQSSPTAAAGSTATTPSVQVSTGTGCGPIINGVRTKRGQGVSCHSCKTSKDSNSLFHCQNKGEKGIKKRRCRKKYCEICLRRSYPSCMPSGAEAMPTWMCPSCLAQCLCASCQRREAEKAAQNGGVRVGGVLAAAHKSKMHPPATPLTSTLSFSMPTTRAHTPHHVKIEAGLSMTDPTQNMLGSLQQLDEFAEHHGSAHGGFFQAPSVGFIGSGLASMAGAIQQNALAAAAGVGGAQSPFHAQQSGGVINSGACSPNLSGKKRKKLGRHSRDSSPLPPAALVVPTDVNEPLQVYATPHSQQPVQSHARMQAPALQLATSPDTVASHLSSWPSAQMQQVQMQMQQAQALNTFHGRSHSQGGSSGYNTPVNGQTGQGFSQSQTPPYGSRMHQGNTPSHKSLFHGGITQMQAGGQMLSPSSRGSGSGSTPQHLSMGADGLITGAHGEMSRSSSAMSPSNTGGSSTPASPFRNMTLGGVSHTSPSSSTSAHGGPFDFASPPSITRSQFSPFSLTSTPMHNASSEDLQLLQQEEHEAHTSLHAAQQRYTHAHRMRGHMQQLQQADRVAGLRGSGLGGQPPPYQQVMSPPHNSNAVLHSYPTSAAHRSSPRATPPIMMTNSNGGAPLSQEQERVRSLQVQQIAHLQHMQQQIRKKQMEAFREAQQNRAGGVLSPSDMSSHDILRTPPRKLARNDASAAALSPRTTADFGGMSGSFAGGRRALASTGVEQAASAQMMPPAVLQQNQQRRFSESHASQFLLGLPTSDVHAPQSPHGAHSAPQSPEGAQQHDPMMFALPEAPVSVTMARHHSEPAAPCSHSNPSSQHNSQHNSRVHSRDNSAGEMHTLTGGNSAVLPLPHIEPVSEEVQQPNRLRSWSEGDLLQMNVFSVHSGPSHHGPNSPRLAQVAEMDMEDSYSAAGVRGSSSQMQRPLPTSIILPDSAPSHASSTLLFTPLPSTSPVATLFTPSPLPSTSPLAQAQASVQPHSATPPVHLLGTATSNSVSLSINIHARDLPGSGSGSFSLLASSPSAFLSPLPSMLPQQHSQLLMSSASGPAQISTSAASLGSMFQAQMNAQPQFFAGDLGSSSASLLHSSSSSSSSNFLRAPASSSSLFPGSSPLPSPLHGADSELKMDFA